ncbi:hypothetical protein [Sphingobacterium lactis]|uniref:hypothetical protein n=1 Tax=Sphingobacterium lactis TaxID=797291 RepID=UPI0011B0E13F|nr:hypothetical protein [Sphingobacterium lactis]
MKTKQIYVVMLFVSLFFIGCMGEKGDVTKDPKYAHIANNIFKTVKPVYYYRYTHSDGSKTGYFLSTEANMPNGELKSELPIGGFVKIAKVLEVPQKDGSVKVMVKGDAFTDFSAQTMEYMALFEDIKPALEIK